MLRLAIANWLAYDELPPDRRPAPDMNVSGPHDFYAFGPEAPAQARALSPAALDRWLNSTADALELINRWDLRAFRVRERAKHRALVILLASELYRRDHKKDPPSDEALVGPYLKELPDDGLGDAGPQAGRGEGCRDSGRAGGMTMATTSSLSRNFPTLRYLAAPFRWFFRSRRRVLTAAAVLLAMIVAPPLWW